MLCKTILETSLTDCIHPRRAKSTGMATDFRLLVRRVANETSTVAVTDAS